MKLIHHAFSEVGQHAAFLADWDQHYFQMDSGNFQSDLHQFDVDDIHLFCESANRRIVQRGSIPGDAIAIGVPLNPPPATMTFSGRIVSSNSIILARPGAEFMLHAPANARLLGIEIKRDYLARHPILTTRLRERMKSNCTIDVPADVHERINTMWRELPEDAVDAERYLGQACAKRRIASLILELVHQLLDNGIDDRKADITWMSHSDVVARAHDMILQSPQEPVTIHQLCESLKISRRAVQNSFHAVTGKSPHEYIRAIRLNLVRETLLRTAASDVTVRDAAQRWGFFHSSRFPRDYRAMFGEMPSDSRPDPHYMTTITGNPAVQRFNLHRRFDAPEWHLKRHQ